MAAPGGAVATATVKGKYDVEKNAASAVTTVAVKAGNVKIKASVTDATFVGGPSLSGLAVSLERPSAFIIDYDLPRKTGSSLDLSLTHIKDSYSEFVNKELIQFSVADLRRSIPCMVDGLKPGQRKILFSSLKKEIFEDIKVSQLRGYVYEKSAYNHDDQSLATTIIRMASDFVGSNNINLLVPSGQFGTRLRGGKDAAHHRYIYTRLSTVTRFIFHKEDDILLHYLNEDGQSIEPIWYMPIIPMVLVNGSEGIGTGWSSFIPNYDPLKIIANLRRLLTGKPMEPMVPWYKGFLGQIEETSSTDAGVTYTVSGIIEVLDSTTLRITELPVGRWTQDYKEFLESMMTGNDNTKEPFIKDYRQYSDDKTVKFEVILSEENMNAARQEGLLKKFKLTSTISTNNMHLIDDRGNIQKYDSPEEILEKFCQLRLKYYDNRKGGRLVMLDADLMTLRNKIWFIRDVAQGKTELKNWDRANLFNELWQKDYIPLPNKTKGRDAAIVEEAEAHGCEVGQDYEYLLSMPFGSLKWIDQLCAEKAKVKEEIAELKLATAESLWLKDLDVLEGYLSQSGWGDIGG